MKKALAVTAAALLFTGVAQAQKITEESQIVMKNIETRTSVRQYSGEKIEIDEFVKPLLYAAMSAPSAMNRQPWEFIVIRDRDMLDEMSEEFKNAAHLKTAQFAIIVCGNMKEAIEGEGRGFWVQDCSAATENLLLAAHSMGLGAVWCGIYPSKERTKQLQDFLALPEHIVPLNIIPIGVPEKEQAPKDKWKEEKIHFDKYDTSRDVKMEKTATHKDIKKGSLQIKGKKK